MTDEITGQPSGGTDTAVLSGGADTPAPATESAAPAQATEAPEAARDATKEAAATTDAPATEQPPEAKEEPKAPSWPEDGFPEDWRERTVKAMGLEGDALKRAQEVAKRAGSPAELLRSVMAGTAKITDLTAELKQSVKIPGDKAKPEEIAAFQKAWGVPEAADKYDLSELGEMSPVDKEVWGEVLPSLHKANFSQAQITEAAKAMKAAEAIAAKRSQEVAEKAAQDTRDALLIEYGSSKAVEANIELANRYLGDLLGKHMDQEARNGFLKLQLADGRSIGAHPGFVKAIIAAAREWSPDGLPDTGDSGQQVDVDARIREITAKAHSNNINDRREYERLQGELDKLIAVQTRRNARAAR